MITVLSALVSLLSFRLRGRASLELELVALRHQVAVLRRRRPGRPILCRADRLLWVCLYRIWPQALHAMVLVKPNAVIQWHRQGFRLYWRWRSRSGQHGRPKTPVETRDLIRQMSFANPLWGAPRIHGELLKLGIVVSQATVGRYMPWRPRVPSPTWRSFLHNHMSDTVAVDMFVVATATFRLLYALIVLGHDRRRIIHFNVTQNPTQVWLGRQMTEAFPWDTAPRYLLRDRDAAYGPAFRGRLPNPILSGHLWNTYRSRPIFDWFLDGFSFWPYGTDIPDPQAPLGARGIGEIGITGTAAAIANAVFNATDKRVRDLPITLDKLL